MFGGTSNLLLMKYINETKPQINIAKIEKKLPLTTVAVAQPL